ncbi:hypothetical protein LAD59_00625 [Klebsiella pneumoniae]|nr:hypothetical protein [Klebsiella pneumoniae]
MRSAFVFFGREGCPVTGSESRRSAVDLDRLFSSWCAAGLRFGVYLCGGVWPGCAGGRLAGWRAQLENAAGKEPLQGCTWSCGPRGRPELAALVPQYSEQAASGLNALLQGANRPSANYPDAEVARANGGGWCEADNDRMR